ncbi:2-C-methyl-D-erythritol 2,4-cyclodiphosphate synthase [Helicobacter sp. 11S02629-2]|uniref:2-C-methyl-D-erythritol 2,4-cyclodiphosphate synthase n=1 Tax=Helicobacter sp. 11S02629-2 TaxID=1476195 RepID=UPI000BC974F8|nr:2-C-methyl-D-erythritol 2,4-cyclodiphosphate synthase [Helicobacter sp. 11S02629-2]PAF45995.1 2-C-methyl-D-erythritol 2,4-cyclodiphosphate synthase [Helicobacter sp. 11S02629-2]
MLSLSVVILAAGSSRRFSYGSKTSIKKQWIRKQDLPLWLYNTYKIQKICTKLNTQVLPKYTLADIIVVGSKEDVSYMKKLANSDIKIVEGGNTRQESLFNALSFTNSDLVLVNDSARFNTSKKVVLKLFNALKESALKAKISMEDLQDKTLDSTSFLSLLPAGIVPYLNITDTVVLESTTTQKTKLDYLNRDKVYLVQTPQLSQTAILKKALLKAKSEGKDYSDESSAINAYLENEKADLKTPLAFVKGSKALKKITYSDDVKLKWSKYALSASGIDIHAFEEGKKMYLCGVEIDSPFGFKAHSDGDVALHAIIDSILGCMNYGDIGELFPDTEALYKDADSQVLLQKVYDYAKSVGFKLISLDLTLLAELPKISPYKTRMQESLTKLLGVSKTNISIKATTTERLGFVGKKEGILVHAVVNMKKISLKMLKK